MQFIRASGQEFAHEVFNTCFLFVYFLEYKATEIYLLGRAESLAIQLKGSIIKMTINIIKRNPISEHSPGISFKAEVSILMSPLIVDHYKFIV